MSRSRDEESYTTPDIDYDLIGPRHQNGMGEYYPTDVSDLQTKVLKSENKRFYLDVKENNRGRFLKITEVNTQARTKNKITFALSSVEEFRNFLNMFADFYNNLGPTPANTTADGKLKSEFMKKDDKRYFLDLKENSRGRFLRVSQVVRYTRQHVAFPATLLVELRNSINEVLEEFGTDDGDTGEQSLPESRECRIEQKKFYFDVGRNDRGVFLRLTEAKNNFRQNITIPRSGWKQMRDILDEFCQFEEEEGEKEVVEGEPHGEDDYPVN